jgi:hypothetical protein
VDAVALALETLRLSHTFLEMQVDRCDATKLFVPRPGSGVASPGAIYAHCIFDEDSAIAELAGEPPLFAAPSWRERFSFEPKTWIDPEWAPRLSYDLDEFRRYARDVYGRTAEVLGSKSAAELAAPVKNYEVIPTGDKVEYRERQVPATLHLLDVVALHTAGHTGEIAILANLGGSSRA